MEEGKNLLKLLGITLAVYISLRYLLPYVIPFLIAYVLVHLLNPLTARIREKIPLKKEIIAGVLLLILLTGCGTLFYYGYRALTSQLKQIAVNFDLYYSGICGWIDGCCCMAEKSLGINVGEIRNFVYSSLTHAGEQIRVYLIPGVFNYSVLYLKKLFHLGLFLLILVVAVILLIKDYDEMGAKLEHYKLFHHVRNISERMWQQGGKYLKAQAEIIGIVILFCITGLWVLGNSYFVLLGIVIGMLDALPFIGTGTLLVPIAVVYLVQGNYKLCAGYLILFGVTYIVREFLEPRLIGAQLGIYPFVMAAVVYTGLYLYGVTGVVLGPVTYLLVREIWQEGKK